MASLFIPDTLVLSQYMTPFMPRQDDRSILENILWGGGGGGEGGKRDLEKEQD